MNGMSSRTPVECLGRLYRASTLDITTVPGFSLLPTPSVDELSIAVIELVVRKVVKSKYMKAIAFPHRRSVLILHAVERDLTCQSLHLYAPLQARLQCAEKRRKTGGAVWKAEDRWE